MGRILEDLVCGALGYGIGKASEKKCQNDSQSQINWQEIPADQSFEMIMEFLRTIDIESAVKLWMKANHKDPECDFVVAGQLYSIADKLTY